MIMKAANLLIILCKILEKCTILWHMSVVHVIDVQGQVNVCHRYMYTTFITTVSCACDHCTVTCTYMYNINNKCQMSINHCAATSTWIMLWQKSSLYSHKYMYNIHVNVSCAGDLCMWSKYNHKYMCYMYDKCHLCIWSLYSHKYIYSIYVNVSCACDHYIFTSNVR